MNDDFVYVIQAESGGPVKIGYSEDPVARLASLQNSHHQELRIVTSFPGSRRVERRIHDLLGDRRIRREWFEDCSETHAAVEQGRQWGREEALLEAKRWLHHQIRQAFERALVPIVEQLDAEDLFTDEALVCDRFAEAGRELGRSIHPLLAEAVEMLP